MRYKDDSLKLRIKEYIETYYKEHNDTPTTRDIAAKMHTASSTAHRYLKSMHDDGMISYIDGVISTKLIDMLNPAVNNAAVVGSIPCGTPDEREAQIEEYLPLPVSVFGDGSIYILHADGDSMINAGIDDGDLVVIREQTDAKIGDIVVAMDNENRNTLKRLIYDNKRQNWCLHPENPAYDDIYPKSLDIQGIATHVIKIL